jgi:hypothetical protein
MSRENVELVRRIYEEGLFDRERSGSSISLSRTSNASIPPPRQAVDLPL